jgi:hypothetical protein
VKKEVTWRCFEDPIITFTTQKESQMSDNSSSTIEAGIGFGCALAICISWSLNKSILWAIVHGILSWIYVVYYAIFL